MFQPAPGLVAVAGGKYTTYRVMAKDAMDEVARLLQAQTGQPVPPSVTAEAVYAASHEGALHLDDVLVRRVAAATR